MAQSGDEVTPDGTIRVPALLQEIRAMLRRGDGELSVGGLGTALELERSSPDALLHMIVQRTVSSRSGA